METSTAKPENSASQSENVRLKIFNPIFITNVFQADTSKEQQEKADTKFGQFAPPNYTMKHTMSGHSKAISCLKFSPDGNILATGSADKTVRIWNAEDGKIEKVIGGHKLGISDLSWTNDSRFIGTCSDDKSLKIFDVTAVWYNVLILLLLFKF